MFPEDDELYQKIKNMKERQKQEEEKIKGKGKRERNKEGKGDWKDKYKKFYMLSSFGKR